MHIFRLAVKGEPISFKKWQKKDKIKIFLREKTRQNFYSQRIIFIFGKK